MLYKGSCHCGNVTFEVEDELTGVVECNCSICSRKGALLWAVPHVKLRLRAANQAPGAYTFHNHVITHRFCTVCGIHPYAEDVGGGAGDRSAYINIRCIEGIDINSIPRFAFDGRSV